MGVFATTMLARPVLSAVGGWLVGRSVWRALRREKLRGKTVVVTGGTRGLGLDLVRLLGAEGCQTALCARDADEIERTRRELGELGIRALARTCDVTDPEQVRAFVDAVLDELGAVDVLITCAATIQVGPFETMTRKDFEEALSSIFWGAYHPTMAVLPHMRQRRAGHIVHITSIGGRIAVPHLLPYCTAKFATTGFSEGLRAEVAKDGIEVTTITPSLMRTGAHENVPFKGQHEKEYAWFAAGASLPLTAMSSETAARRIISAIEHHDAESTLSPRARTAVVVNAVAPSFTAALFALENRLLPSGGSRRARRGAEVAAASSSTVVNAVAELGRATAEAHHEYPGPVLVRP